MDSVVREPLQSRSRNSLESVIAAGITIVAEKGFDGFSIAEVSARSGVSVGSIYQRFGNKAALFSALQERILSDIDSLQDRLFAKLDTGGLADGAIIDAAIACLATHFQKHEALLRVMILRGATDGETRDRGSRSSLGLARNFESFIVSNVRSFGHEEPELAVDVCFRMIYASLTRRIMSGPTFESPTEIGWGRFVAELSRACQTYLLRKL